MFMSHVNTPGCFRMELRRLHINTPGCFRMDLRMLHINSPRCFRMELRMLHINTLGCFRMELGLWLQHAWVVLTFFFGGGGGVLRMDNVSMLSLTAILAGVKLNFLIMSDFIHARGLA